MKNLIELAQVVSVMALTFFALGVVAGLAWHLVGLGLWVVGVR